MSVNIDKVHEQFDMETMLENARRGYSKEPRFQSLELMEHTRLSPCSVPGCRSEESDSHHVNGRGAFGNLASDLFMVPLCREHHSICERMGNSRFEEKHQIVFAGICQRNIESFLRKQNLATSYRKK